MLLAVSLQHPDWQEIGHRVVAIVTFLLATSAGFRIARSSNARSSWLLFLAQGVLIAAVSLPFVSSSHYHDLWLVAGLCLALGLQNGAVTSAGGVSLHATFLSGDVTSLIKIFSQHRSGDSTHRPKKDTGQPMSLKAVVLLTVVLSFVAGACCAGPLTVRFDSLSPLALLLPLGAAALFSNMHASRS